LLALVITSFVGGYTLPAFEFDYFPAAAPFFSLPPAAPSFFPVPGLFGVCDCY